MAVVQVVAKVVVDDSGFQSEIPVLITDHGVVSSLVDYLLSNHHLSPSWQRVVTQATKLLLEYMEANQHNFSDPRALFQAFASRLYTGTIGDDGLDPSGLGWVPASRNTSNRHVSVLKGFTDYLADLYDAPAMNPLITASTFDQRLNYAAWHRRNSNDFLGHIKSKALADNVAKARNIRGRRTLSKVDDDAVAFPEKLFQAMYMDGFGGAKDPRCAVRDQLILIMMHGAGLRESDAQHLWVMDVVDHPLIEGGAMVRVFHPEDGRAPDDWRGRKGATTRAAYLREQYALTARNLLQGTKRIGWKTRMVDHADNYIQLHWFPPRFSVLFMQLWKVHVRYLTTVERHHPYAFVSYDESAAGQPYTLQAFNGNYKRALARIGQTVSKPEGRSTHGHRHAFGRRLTKAGVTPQIIRKALHHTSLESQKRYTAPGVADVSSALTAAEEKLRELADSGHIISSFNNWDEALPETWADLESSRAPYRVKKF
ncbi:MULTISPECIES: gamma-mobile-trio recombinase GmtY [unclassified Pseudomonas]|uniref:gamma-mobile-trio recombinase GmtY n=1 Tax=unclassified Pseudomonas TaxID=196821 RepID=UPI00026FE24D|nr:MULTISPECIES: gamma-mobile-trio recombinase GmtY [unclassified Pseudomonas]EUB84643.1 integrase family protein [Pseudomonas sp. GM30]